VYNKNTIGNDKLAPSHRVSDWK